MVGRGFIFDLMDEISNAPTVHQRLIKSYEDRFNSSLLCYIALFGHPAGAVGYQDGEIIEKSTVLYAKTSYLACCLPKYTVTLCDVSVKTGRVT